MVLARLPGHTAPVPVPLTPLVGRRREVRDAIALLARSDVRLLTLIGPGGVGKTRLALRIAADASDAFRDGVLFVPLASIRDPALVAPAFAQAFDVRDHGARPLIERLHETFQARRHLLVLDNFEQVIDAAPLLADLLMACPDLTALVTSRMALRVSGEQEFPVHPFPLPARPDDAGPPPLADLARNEAVTLFVQRTRKVKPDFSLTPGNAPAVAEICTRLDGLPLAIELAAARSKALSPTALLARLANRLALLTGGPRDAPARLQTMRNAIAWSYDLLTPDEQTLFRRLSVFAGGCTLDAAEVVGGRREAGGRSNGVSAHDSRLTTHDAVLDVVSALADKSLVRLATGADGESRVLMLETIREFGLEELRVQGEDAAIRGAHAGHVLALAERADPALFGPDQVRWLDVLEVEHDNARAALAWALERHAAETALRLSAALRRFWATRGHVSEGRDWLARAVAAGEDAPPSMRAEALHAAGQLAENQHDYIVADSLLQAALEAWRQVADQRGMARALTSLGSIASYRGEYDRAAALHDEALALARQSGDDLVIATILINCGVLAYYQGNDQHAETHWTASLTITRRLGDIRSIANVLSNLGVLVGSRGDFTRAVPFFEEALERQRQLGDKRGTAISLMNLGEAIFSAGDPARAAPLFEEALALFRECGSRRDAAASTANLGRVAQAEGDLSHAAALLAESVGLFHDIGNRLDVTESLEMLAGVAAAGSEGARAARLLGRAAALRDDLGAPLHPDQQANVDLAVAAARQQLEPTAYAAAFDKGRSLPLPAVVAAATELAAFLAAAPSIPPAPSTAPVVTRTARDAALAADLSPREREVLYLVVEGYTTRQIADALFISPRTATTHITHILNKLGVNSRAAAVAQALRQGLI
ncbi:MAG: tetratricopeptide repeat protein [Thermomicrobiales bacterium]